MGEVSFVLFGLAPDVSGAGLSPPVSGAGLVRTRFLRSGGVRLPAASEVRPPPRKSIHLSSDTGGFLEELSNVVIIALFLKAPGDHKTPLQGLDLGLLKILVRLRFLNLADVPSGLFQELLKLLLHLHAGFDESIRVHATDHDKVFRFPALVVKDDHLRPLIRGFPREVFLE